MFILNFWCIYLLKNFCNLLILNLIRGIRKTNGHELLVYAVFSFFIFVAVFSNLAKLRDVCLLYLKLYCKILLSDKIKILFVDFFSLLIIKLLFMQYKLCIQFLHYYREQLKSLYSRSLGCFAMIILPTLLLRVHILKI